MVLSIGAAVITGTVVLGVVAGPAAGTCLQRGDFWSCMNQTMLGGQPEAATAETAAQPESADADAAPSDDGAQQPAATAQAPTFDLVRVEPDGSAVFAGSATPSGEVLLFLNDDELGSETVDPSGDWVFVTDEPLAAGGVELRVFDVETEQYADTAMIVVVQDDRTGEPLVIASTPGEASEILQGLDQSEPVSVAQAPQADTPEAQPVEIQPSAEQPADEPTLTVAQSDEIAATEAEPPAAEMPEPTLATTVDDEPETAQTETLAAAERAVGEPAEAPAAVDADEPLSLPSLADAQPLPVAETTTPMAAVAPDSGPETPPAIGADDATAVESTSPATEEALAATTSETLLEAPDAAPQTPLVPTTEATPEDEQQTPSSDDAIDPQEPQQIEQPAQTTPPATQAVAAVPATIDAIEIDGDLNFFAGSGAEGSLVRLYVENRLIGSGIVADGRWLVEAIGALTEESQRVRIDMIGADGAVASRAEVDFVLDLPVIEAPIVVAEQPPAQTPDTAPLPSAAPSAEPEEVLEASEPQAAATELVTEQPEQTAAPQGGGSAMATPQPEAEAAAPQDTASGSQDVPASDVEDAPASDVEDAPAAEEQRQAVQPDPTSIESTEPDSVPTMVGVTEGSRTTSGLAIIRRGDNLWTIALRVYGEGIRYTQIFEANTDQIRNPNLIYPGQVFDLPDTDAVVGDDDQD